MEYNSTRSRLNMPEYGRNVQAMAEYLLTIKDDDARLKAAEYLIEVMTILTPHLKTIEEYKHKLWDHLYQMTDYQLEVKGPYPKPTAEEMHPKPAMLPYPQTRIKHRHLGKGMETMLEKALAETDEEKRQVFTQHIGYFMKLAYANWHKEPMQDDQIRNELSVLSGGLLTYEPGGYKVHIDVRSNQQPGNNFKRKFKNNNQRNNGGGGGGGGGNNFNRNRKFKNKGNKL